MNKNLFRIIFNKHRGQLVAVSEKSCSQGKGTRGEAGASTGTVAASNSAAALCALSFAVLCALGAVLWALPTPHAHAQVVAYRNAPSNQQPTILQTANGVPQVDIQTPSAAGVSRNVYSQFDVQSNGVILNNSRINVQTQQGGWIQGNPWLATGGARVILNEVNSSNPSYLNGYVEVAGQRAEVVIANPSGISVNGGGFINTSKATLTTGTPIVNSGSLDGYRVQGGSVTVNGKGLDLSTTDHAAILARAVQVNAGIWANELKVVTGANDIDASSLGANTTPVTTTIAGTGAVPSFALDVAQIGGMYAGKIHLIGTEQGLGVRSAGTIGSTGGDLVLQNNGWLTTTGTLQASANLQITTQGNITNSGTLYASNDQTISSTGSIANSGIIASQGNTSITANSLSSTAPSVLGAGVKPDGTLANSGNLIIATTQVLAANGQNLASGDINLTGASVDLQGSQTSAANITISANSGNVSTANATVATSGTAGVLAITAKTNNDQTLDNTLGVLSAGQLNIDVANLTNVQGQIIQTGVGDTSIALTSSTGKFNNTGGTVAVNSKNLSIAANVLGNNGGKIQHAGAGALSVIADTLSSVKGQVVSNSNMALTIGTALDNTQGSIYAHKNLLLASNGAITNTGFIAAQGNATLSANSLSSSSTGVLGAGIKADGTLASSGDLAITTTQALSANGQNLASGNITLNGSSVNLSGSQTGAANIDITAISGDADTSKATIATSGILAITAKANNNQTLNNNQGVLSAGQLKLDVANLNNSQGSIIQTGNGAMAVSVAQGLDNTAGTLASNGNLTLAAQSLTNNQGQVSALGDLTVNLNTTPAVGAPQNAGALSNLQGLVAAKGNVAITAFSVDNTLGTLASVDKNLSVITTGATNNDSGKIQSALNLTLSNAGLSNTRTTHALGTSTSPYGSIIGRQVDINTHTQTLNNAGGTIAATQTANLQTGALNNNGGLIQTGSDLTIHTHGQTLTNTNAGSYTNSNTALNGKGGIASQGTSTFTTGDLNNEAGYIGSKGAMTANSTNISNTQGGQIQGLGNLTLTAVNGSSTGAINNTGGLIRSAATTSLSAVTVTNSNTSGTGLGIEGLDVSVSANTLRNDNGAMRADNNIAVTSAGMVDNSTGLMSAGNTLSLQDVQARSSRTLAITNTNATLLAGQSLVVAANSMGGDGNILSKGNLNLALKADFVNSGQIIANGNATISTTGNVNNSGKLQAGNTLDLTADNIDNTATGEISGNTTQVNAIRTLINRGLIDGVDTQVNAHTVNNIGIGRIYGDHLSIAAVNLTNDTETVAGVTKAGTIAARDRLDLGISGTLTNSEHALIYSVGDMAIGGAIDASRRATGQAAIVNNKSATIEAGRNLSLSGVTINNTNEHFAYEERKTSEQSNVREDVTSTLYRVFTRKIYDPYILSTDPGQILSGANMSLNAAEVSNQLSQIIAGGSLNISAGALQNTSITSLHRVVDVGNSYNYQKTGESCWFNRLGIKLGCNDNYGWVSSSYGPPSANQTVTVSQTRSDAYTTPTQSSTQITNLARNRVTEPTDNTGTTDTSSANVIPSTVSLPQSNSAAVEIKNSLDTKFTVGLAAQTLAVRAASPNTILPSSSLYKTNPSGNASYLVETDPRFTNDKLWLGSEFMTQSLSLDPSVTQKRLGDGFYEQKLIREQVAQLTGRRFLANYTSDEQEYQALMESGITFAKQYNLRPGIALTAQQVAQLTSDIVWLVEQAVTLPNGATQKVLVPQVYAKVQPGDLDGSGALLAGKDININLSGDLTNSGTIAGRNVLSLTAENVNNLGGRIDGNDVSVAARQDLNNIGASITAVESLSANAGRDLTLQTTTSTGSSAVGANSFSRTNIDRVAGLYVSGANGTLVASAGRDMNITASVVSNSGTGATNLSAENNFTLSSVTTSSSDLDVWNSQNYRKSTATRDVGSQISGAGNVALKAGQTLSATAADVQALGALNVNATDIKLQAGQATQSVDEAHQSTSSGFFSKSTTTTRESSSSTTAIGSSLSGNTVNLNASQDITVQASSIEAQNALVLKAGRDVQVLAGVDEQSSLSYSKTEKQTTGILAAAGRALGAANVMGDKMPGNPLQMGSLLLQSRRQDTNQAVQTNTTVRSSSLSGGTVDINSARDTTLQAAQVVADGAVNVQAGGQIKLLAADQTQQSNASSSSDKSGLLTRKALSSSIGTSQQTQNEQLQGTTSVVTQIASLGKNSAGQTVANANVTLQAQDKISGEGASLLAPSGDISVQAQNIELLEARNSTTAASAQTSKTKANTTQVGSSLISTAQNLQRAKKLQDQSEQSGNSRTQSLAQLNTALSAYNAYNAASGGGSGSNPDTPTPTAGPTAGFTMGSSYGTSQSSSTSQQSSATSTQGQVAAGGNISFKATGAGQDSNLTLRGQNVQAGGKITLAADNQVNLLAAQDTASQQSNNQSSSNAVGATFALGGNQNGLSFQASANKALGNANGDSTTYNNTQVAAKQVQIDSGGDTTLKGAVVKADQVTANVGGNLNIESLQDSATYKDKQNSAGVGVSICVPPFCFGQAVIVNVSAAKAKINSDYQSVTEQSGLKAGDGGFTVNVKGNTDLKGAAITSTQAAIDNNKNTFNTGGKLTTSDIENKAAFEAKSVSVSISTGGGGAAGFGSDSGQASSTTKAAISGIAGDTAARTGDKEAGIKPIFDANKVKADVQLQTAVTGEFGRNASKAVGDLGTSKTKPYTDAKNYTDLKKAQEEGRLDASSALVLAGLEKAGMTADKANQMLNDPQVQADYNNWKEGGTYRVVLHTVVGGLTGGVAGAAGAGTVSAAAPTLDEVQGQMTQALVKAGMEAKTAQGLAGAVTGVGAAGIGAAVSGGTTAGAATAFNADVNNRQLHPTETKLIKANAKAYAQQRFGTANPSDAQLSQAETELTQQALKQVDSANATYADNQNAAIFLSQVARVAGPNQDVGGGTLFDARGTSAYNNQAINAGLLDQSKDLLSNVNAPGNRPGTTAYQYNLNAAAMDKANLANQPAQVKQQVFAELKDQYQAQANELTPQLLRTDPSAYAQKEQQLQNTFGTLLRMVTDQGVSYLDKTDLTWYQSNIQNKAMGVAAGAMALSVGKAVGGATKPTDATNSIGARVDMVKEAMDEVAAAKADAAGIAKTKVENNIYRDGSSFNLINSNEVNARYEAAGKSAPYMPNTPVIQDVAPAGTVETQVISSGQKTAIDKGVNAIGNFSTTDNVPHQGYATGELAITTPATLPPNATVAPFKADVNYTVQIETQQPTPYNKGVVGPQPGSAGRGNQTEWLIPNGEKNSFIQPVPNSIKPLLPAPSSTGGK